MNQSVRVGQIIVYHTVCLNYTCEFFHAGSLVRKMLESKREAETVQQKGPQRDKVSILAFFVFSLKL